MSKDEYLITDAPLKALTVFAMPMILGSFFQQIYNMADSIIVGQFVDSSALAAVGACAALTNVFICVALGAGVGAGVLLFRCQRIWQNENHCVYITDKLFTSEHHPWCLWLCLFSCDDERITDPCRYSGGSGTIFAGLFCGFPVFVHVQYSFYYVHIHR